MPRFIRIKPLSTIYNLTIVMKPILTPICLTNPHISHNHPHYAVHHQPHYQNRHQSKNVIHS